jgi:hypothetical protein
MRSLLQIKDRLPGLVSEGKIPKVGAADSFAGQPFKNVVSYKTNVTSAGGLKGSGVWE